VFDFRYFEISEDSLRELTDFIFHHFGEASSGVQAALFKWKKDYEEVQAFAKARAKPDSSSSKKNSNSSLKFGPSAKRRKASPGSPKPTTRSEDLRLVLKSSPLNQLMLPLVMSTTRQYLLAQAVKLQPQNEVQH
jgi:hypothetical protein